MTGIGLEGGIDLSMEQVISKCRIRNTLKSWQDGKSKSRSLARQLSKSLKWGELTAKRRIVLIASSSSLP
jgi:hypothetical protein